MLDSDQEPSYNLSKNLLLLPKILKLIEDMEVDSTPLNKCIFDTWSEPPFTRHWPKLILTLNRPE